jgi:hypothetical protein
MVLVILPARHGKVSISKFEAIPQAKTSGQRIKTMLVYIL